MKRKQAEGLTEEIDYKRNSAKPVGAKENKLPNTQRKNKRKSCQTNIFSSFAFFFEILVRYIEE